MATITRQLPHNELTHTAVHEAGHAVAHIRLGIDQSDCTIEPGTETLGAATAEGAGHVWDAESAADQVLAFCSGYAALVAAGADPETAMQGAWDDMAQAEELIRFWGLEHDLAHWQERAVRMMAEPQNTAAVELVARWLLQDQTVDGDLVQVLVELSDGEVSPEDFDRYLVLREAQ